MARRKKARKLAPEVLELIAERFRVLSEPVRLEILQALRGSELTVSEVEDQLGIGQSSASKHLKKMYEAGMLSRRREGNSILYSVTDPVVWKICESVCDGLEQQQKDRTDVLRRGGLGSR